MTLLTGVCASSFMACSKTRPPASGPRAVDAPLAQRALPSLEEEGHGDLLEAFEAMGSIDLGQFEGVYGYPGELGLYPGLSIEENVLRFGAVLRAEISPVRVIDRDADELLAVAVVHEDIDDPGDASLAYVLLRTEPDGDIFLSMGWTSEELWDPEFGDSLVRVERPLPGLDYRPLEGPREVPRGLYELQTCDPLARSSFDGGFELDLSSLPREDDVFERNLRDAAYQRLLGTVFIRDGGFTDRHGEVHVCFLSVNPEAEGVAVEFEAMSFEFEQTRFWALLTPTDDGVLIRFARRRDGLSTAAPLRYRRVGSENDVLTPNETRSATITTEDTSRAFLRAVEAAEGAPLGADDCESAFNQMIAMLDVVAADLNQPTLFRPGPSEFLAACRRLPAAAQRCAVSTYANANLDACSVVFDAVAPRDMQHFQDVVQGP